MFLRWWRMGEDSRRRVWLLYGWFSGLMFCGSCCGVISSVAWMRVSELYITNNHPTSTLTSVEFWSNYALVFRWCAVHFTTSALEFFSLSVAKLMVLHRMVSFAVPKGDSSAGRFVAAGRMVMVCAVLGNVIGFTGNIAAAVQWNDASDRALAAAVAFAANSADASELSKLASQQEQVAAGTGSVQQFSEVTVLLLIIVAFLVVGVTCARRVSSALHRMDDDESEASAIGKKMRRQIVATVVVVFATFLMRATYSTMWASANALQNQGDDCSSRLEPCNSACANVYLLMLKWMLFTPEFQSLVLLMSSPLSLLVALWGMTTDRMLQLMNTRAQADGTALATRSGRF